MILMNRRLLLLTLPILLLSIAMLFSTQVPRAHAATGAICLQDPFTNTPLPANPCPATAPTLNAPRPTAPQVAPTQIRMGVYISGSDAMNGFDVILSADPTVLKPAGIDLSGSVLAIGGNPSIVVECLSGILITGPTCTSSDSITTLHLGAQAPLGAISANPISGLMFTAIYNVTGATTRAIPISYAVFCLKK